MVEKLAINNIDTRFVHNTDFFNMNEDSVTCDICFNIINDAVECNICQHHFCRKCIELLCKNSNISKCPNKCLKPIFTEIPRILKNMLSKIEFICPQKCEKIITYDNYLNHSNTCIGKIVDCPTCKTRVKFDQLDKNTIDLISKINSLNSSNTKILEDYNTNNAKYKNTVDVLNATINKSKIDSLNFANQMKVKDEIIAKIQNELKATINKTKIDSLDFVNQIKIKDQMIAKIQNELNVSKQEIKSNIPNIFEKHLAKIFPFTNESKKESTKKGKEKKYKIELTPEELKLFYMCNGNIQEEFEAKDPSCVDMIAPIKSNCHHYERNFKIILSCCKYRTFNCLYDHNNEKAKHNSSKSYITVCNKCNKKNRRDAYNCKECGTHFYSKALKSKNKIEHSYQEEWLDNMIKNN